jgi:hypothetical protein
MAWLLRGITALLLGSGPSIIISAILRFIQAAVVKYILGGIVVWALWYFAIDFIQWMIPIATGIFTDLMSAYVDQDTFDQLRVDLSFFQKYVGLINYIFPLQFAKGCLQMYLNFSLVWWMFRRITGMIPFLRM